MIPQFSLEIGLATNQQTFTVYLLDVRFGEGTKIVISCMFAQLNGYCSCPNSNHYALLPPSTVSPIFDFWGGALT